MDGAHLSRVTLRRRSIYRIGRGQEILPSGRRSMILISKMICA